MANIFLVSHILLLFHSPKGSWNKSAKYEKLGKYWPYCTQNRAITNAYLIQNMINQVIRIYHSTLELIFLIYCFCMTFIFLHVWHMLRFDKATYLSLPYKFTLSKRLINNLWGSDVLVFSEFINIVSILFIILFCTFLVISFPRNKGYAIWRI